MNAAKSSKQKAYIIDSTNNNELYSRSPIFAKDRSFNVRQCKLI